MESIPWDGFGIGSGWALAALAVYALIRGQLVPRKTVEDIIHDRDEWRAAHRISEAARVEGEGHWRTMSETARTLEQFMREVQDRHGLGGAETTPTERTSP